MRRPTKVLSRAQEGGKMVLGNTAGRQAIAGERLGGNLKDPSDTARKRMEENAGQLSRDCNEGN